MTLATLLGALSAPSRPPPILTPRPPAWLVAAFLAEAVQGTREAEALQRAARQVVAEARAVPDETCAAARERAIVLRDRIAAHPHEDRVPIMLATLRELLVDAPHDGAVDLDRRCATASVRIEARHELAAGEVLA